MLVRIVKTWKYPDLFRQTPKFEGVWDGIKFTEEAVENCDYVIVLNFLDEDLIVNCNKDRMWCVQQEHVGLQRHFVKRMHRQFGKMFIQDLKFKGKKFIYNQGALPWHVDKDYDFLKSCGVPEKTGLISTVTSNLKNLEGQVQRLKFLDIAGEQLEIERWGKGFQFVKDKWDGIAPYKYSIAMENTAMEHYWTEKLTDCFLSWTMPIYYGCKNILDYFPAESMILIDINNPEESVEIIKEAIENRKWEKSLDAIKHARELILDRYQFFPLISKLVKEDQAKDKEQSVKRIHLKNIRKFDDGPLLKFLKDIVKSILRFLKLRD